GFPVLRDGAGCSPRGRALPGRAYRDTGDFPIRPCLGVLRGEQGQQPMTHRDRTQSHHRDSMTGARRVGRSRRYLVPMMRHALLVAVAIAFMVPFYWMAISALKDNSQIFARPPQWWPHPVRWDNVRQALTYPGFPFLRFLWNSVFYAGCVSFGTVLSSAAVGYGFARLH